MGPPGSDVYVHTTTGSMSTETAGSGYTQSATGPSVTAGLPGLRLADRVARSVLDQTFRVHVRLGPGLTERVYEALLQHYLLDAGHQAVRQKRFSFEVDGVVFEEAVRPDLIIDEVLVVEVKSAKVTSAVDRKQLLTTLRVLDLEVGLLLNFGCATMKEGIRRVVNNYKP